MPPLVLARGQRCLISGSDSRNALAYQHVRVEDDVFGREAGPPGEQVVGPGADLCLPLGGVGLALLVEGHDDDAGAVAPDRPGVLEEGFLAFLEADRVDDSLALHTLEAGLQHAPPRAVDHYRDAGGLRFGRDQVQEGGHGLFAVQQVRVHVHVEQVGAAPDLIEGDVHRGLVIVGLDEPAELRRAGDVGPLADHHEPGVAGDRERFQPGQPGDAACPRRGRGTSRPPLDGPGDRGDVCGRGAAAAPGDVHHALGGELVQVVRCFLRTLVIAAEGVGQPRIGMAGRIDAR